MATVVDNLRYISCSTTSVPCYDADRNPTPPEIDPQRVEEYVKDVHGEFIGLLIAMSHIVLPFSHLSFVMGFGGGFIVGSSVTVDPQQYEKFPLDSMDVVHDAIDSLISFMRYKFARMVSGNQKTASLELRMEFGRFGGMHVQRNDRLIVHPDDEPFVDRLFRSDFRPTSPLTSSSSSSSSSSASGGVSPGRLPQPVPNVVAQDDSCGPSGEQISFAPIDRGLDVGWPKPEASYALVALQFFQPQTKHHVVWAWKLAKTWNQVELPTRSTPFSPEILLGMAGQALKWKQFRFRCLLVLGFAGNSAHQSWCSSSGRRWPCHRPTPCKRQCSYWTAAKEPNGICFL